MKKKIFLVSTLVAIAIGAMFVSCNKESKNEPTNNSSGSNGCKCTIREADGTQDVENFSKMDMAEVGATTCGELASAIRAMYAVGAESSVTVLCE